ncbi:type I restriction endonuclease subunit R [Hathewaya massiliensis]|uniref:type I restriction endonuclease subunit R n=1 Tax=Hathewaya massiliensis TaxID=1964382 RepID=UPI001159239D|nr:HsdR family type I site-specific deoxyribonuclease [Hathewaya massiliensis]
MDNPYLEGYDQDNVIELLKNMGYKYIEPEECVALRGGRLKEVILKDITRKKLMDINSFEYKGTERKFSESNINKAIDSLDMSLTEGLIKANEKIYYELVMTKSLEEFLEDGNKKSFSLKYIDWDNPKNNDFHFTQEFVVEKQDLSGEEKTKRPDIVLFINGIPFCAIELKASAISLKQGISQMIGNQKKDNIPHLFKYVQLVLAGNTREARYATTGTPAKFWSVWQEEDDVKVENYVKGRLATELDRSIVSLLNLDRVLEIIREYTLFDNNIKKVARYQQYFGIKRTLERIETFDNSGRRNGGLIWHTQGSGKSLTMVMLARALRRRVNNAKIIIVTDRKELDSQIKKTFEHSGFSKDIIKASSGSHLNSQLKSKKSKIITTIINKFDKVFNIGSKIDDPNIFVLVDESHRTQNGQLHAKMRKVFPSGCYIGFTGTPLMKKDKNSFTQFGKEIHRYTINQAVDDKAVLPLLYEGRLVDQWINDELGLERKFEMISRNLNEEQKEDLKIKWGRFQKVASSERRLEMIALDINEHYKNTWQGTGFKAMLATSSKFEAIRYHQIFQQYGDVKTAFVISSADNREGNDDIHDENKLLVQKELERIVREHGNLDDYETKIKDEFCYGEDVEILIVVDKLLTGFDAPPAIGLYVDKELKEHKLLQAIARVNRLYEGKDYGYIIDYRGLLGNLDKALTSYSSLEGFEEDDIKGAVIDIKKHLAELKSNYSYLKDIFNSIKNKTDKEEYEVYLADESKRLDFYDRLKNYAKSLNICLASQGILDLLSKEELENYKKELKFFSNLRKSVRLRYHEEVDFGEYEEQMQKLLDTYISANEVNRLTKLVNIFDDKNFDEEIQRVEGKRAKADTIRNALDKVITMKYDENPAYYEALKDRIKRVLEEYRRHRISEEEYLSSMNDVMTDVRNGSVEETYPCSISSNKPAQVIYDNIKKDIYETISAKAPEEQLEHIVANTSLQFDEIIKTYAAKPDWTTNTDIHNQISQDLEEKLWDLEDEYEVSLDTDKILEKTITISIRKYGR